MWHPRCSCVPTTFRNRTVHATVWHPRCSCVPTTFRNRCPGHRVAPTLLMCTDHLPQQVSRPPCGIRAAHVFRPPSATGVQATVWHPRCSCVPTTFRNRSPGHRVAPTLLMCADHLPQQVSRPPCGTHAAHVCRPPSATGLSIPPCGTHAAHVFRPPSATGVHATVWHPRCSCVPTTFRNRSPGHRVAPTLLMCADHLPQQDCPRHRVAPTLLMCADHLPQQESMPPCGTDAPHVCRPPSATGVHATVWHPRCCMCADHLPQQVSRPPCGTHAAHVCRPPSATTVQATVWHPRCSCVPTTFRNNCPGHRVAPTLLMCADHLPQHESRPPCGTNAAHVCPPPSATGVQATVWHPRCSCVPTTFRNTSPCHRVAPTLLMCADHLPQQESMPPCGTNAAHVCRPPSATGVQATVWHPRCSCVPTTFRNRSPCHRVAPTLLHVCRPPSATGV